MKENKNFKLKSICHSCVSENPAENKALHTAGSSGRANACPRMTGESGRSMVEMLGVLAVMGVLSVGGVAMYTSAMNKHRANEILNEASKRAVMVAAQAMTGKTGEISLSEFGNNTVSGVSFGANATIENNQITLTLSGDGLSDVCPQMIAATGTNSAMQVAPGCGTITFNADMSKGGAPASSEENTTPCNGHGYKDSNDDCVCDPGYSGTDCATAACTTGTYCGSGATKECCATDEVCTTSGDVAGTCVKNSSGCTTNGSCIGQTVEATTCTSENCYCKLENTEYNCNAPNKGTCTTLDAGRETTYTDSTDTTKTKTFLVSSDGMSWWAADNWCKAHDMKLVSYHTLNSLFDCDKDEANDYESPSCTWRKFTTSGNWSNGTLSDYSYWTAESYNSCYAWAVNVKFGAFSLYDRYLNLNSSALCE